jgi:hypothetical protein
MESDAIPQDAQQETGDENNPQPQKTVSEIGPPTPGAAVKHAEDASADEVPAQDEEDDNRLMSCRAKYIERGK